MKAWPFFVKNNAICCEYLCWMGVLKHSMALRIILYKINGILPMWVVSKAIGHLLRAMTKILRYITDTSCIGEDGYDI